MSAVFTSVPDPEFAQAAGLTSGDDGIGEVAVRTDTAAAALLFD